MKSHLYLAAAFLFLINPPIFADDTDGLKVPTLTLKNGQTFEEVTLKKKNDSQASLFHSSGLATVALNDLPIEIAEKLGYSKEKAEALEKSRAEVEEQKKAAILDSIDFKGLRLRLPLSEIPSMIERTLWSYDNMDILLEQVDVKSPNTTLKLSTDSGKKVSKNGFTGDQLNDFAAIGKEGFGTNTFWYSWTTTKAQFVDGVLAQIKVFGSDWTADKLKTHTLRWLELAAEGLRKKYGEPTEVLIPLSKFNVLDAESGYVVYVSRWDIRNQTIYLGVLESESKFTPIIVFYDNALKMQIDSIEKGESKL